MNKDQVKGAVGERQLSWPPAKIVDAHHAVKDAAGKVQQKAGEAVGSTSQQAKGLEKQVEGKAQKAVGDVKNVAKK